MSPKFFVAITGCDFFDYTASAVRSCLEHTPDCLVLIVDDASPSWPDPAEAAYPPALAPFMRPEYVGKVALARFDTNFGLTRSLNAGCRFGRLAEAEYTCLSNNDVLFTPGWTDALVYALEHGYDLASPVTNAPGPTAGGRQRVTNYMDDYKTTDDEKYLAVVAARLRERVSSPFESRVNGFCYMAKTSGWWANAYNFDREQVFCPENTHNSKGVPNPTPTMSLMEDEYQHRLYTRGGKAAVCPGSFVFHFRSVWRGDRYKRDLWYRRQA